MPKDIAGQPEKHEDGSEQDWEANSAYRAIVEAETAKANAALMKRVARVAERHIKAAEKVVSAQDIRDMYKKKFPPKLRYEKA